MNGDALLFMTASWCIIVGLGTFCFTRLFAGRGRSQSTYAFSSKPEEKEPAPVKGAKVRKIPRSKKKR